MMIATGLWSRDAGKDKPNASKADITNIDGGWPRVVGINDDSARTTSDAQPRSKDTVEIHVQKKTEQTARREVKKAQELDLANQWSRQEIQWEKERRRKANRSKKVKRKKKAAGEEGDAAEEIA